MAIEIRDRYDHLLGEVEALRDTGVRHFCYLEIGTYDGMRAERLLRYWMKHSVQFKLSASYYGFDMFEQLTQERSAAEFSKKRLPPSCHEVRKRMSAINKVAINLYIGDTRTSLPPFIAAAVGVVEPNLIFLDGGHSLETVASDWKNLEILIGPDTVVLLDDYYDGRADFGCRKLVDEVLKLDPRYKVELLDPVDRYERNELAVRFVKVTRTHEILEASSDARRS